VLPTSAGLLAASAGVGAGLAARSFSLSVARGEGVGSAGLAVAYTPYQVLVKESIHGEQAASSARHTPQAPQRKHRLPSKQPGSRLHLLTVSHSPRKALPPLSRRREPVLAKPPAPSPSAPQLGRAWGQRAWQVPVNGTVSCQHLNMLKTINNISRGSSSLA
jgi:hypothetical protein